MPSPTPVRFALFLSFVLAASAAAQPGPGGVLVGTVADPDGAPLAGASVALYAPEDDGTFVTGAATDAAGGFRLEGVPPGTYRVRVSFVGYAADERGAVEVRTGTPTDLGAIALAPDAAQLGEAEVSAQRELVEQRADRTVYNVAAQPVTAGGSALEALQTLPSIEVDAEGNLSLRGGQNVAVHLNGRPVPVRGAQLAALLRQIPAQNVERVEVMANPSARYEPDGMSGIIDLMLKQNTDRGLSGGVTLGGGTFPSGQASGNLAYQRGAFDVSASYGYRRDGFALDGTSSRVRLLDAGETATDQTFGLDNATNSHLLTATLDWTAAPGTVLGFSGTLGFRDGDADQDVAYVFDPGAIGERRSIRRTDGLVDGLTQDLALTARREIGEGHRLSAEARFTSNDDDRNEQFIDVFVVPDEDELYSRSQIANGVDEGSAKVDYVRPLIGFTVEAGVKATARTLGASRAFQRGERPGAQPTPVVGLSGDFGYDETVGAAYAQASRGIGPVRLQAGLRAETARRDVVPGFGLDPIEDRYASLYPSAFALYTLSPGTTLKASTSRRVNRPNAQFLNPTPQFQDTLIVDRGNPLLRPEYTTAWELSAQYEYVLTVTPFYRRTTDVIRRRIVFDPATGVTTGTFQNLDTADSYGADVTLAPRFGPARGVLSGSVYRSVTDGGSVETGLGSDGLVYTVRGNVQAEVVPGLTVQAFGFYRGPIETEDGRISPFGFGSLGGSYKISDRLTLSANVNDVLGTARFSFETGTDDYRFTGERVLRLRQATATLTYTFGQAGPPRPRPRAQPQGGGLDAIGI